MCVQENEGLWFVIVVFWWMCR